MLVVLFFFVFLDFKHSGLLPVLLCSAYKPKSFLRVVLHLRAVPLLQDVCEEVGVVKRVHTLLGGMHRLATALKVVEEVQEEVQEIKDE